MTDVWSVKRRRSGFNWRNRQFNYAVHLVFSSFPFSPPSLEKEGPVRGQLNPSVPQCRSSVGRPRRRHHIVVSSHSSSTSPESRAGEPNYNWAVPRGACGFTRVGMAFTFHALEGVGLLQSGIADKPDGLAVAFVVQEFQSALMQEDVLSLSLKIWKIISLGKNSIFYNAWLRLDNM